MRFNEKRGLYLGVLYGLMAPLLAYVDAMHEAHPSDVITVVLPEYVPGHWWEHLLHNQTALRIKGALLFRRGVITANVPYHLQTDDSLARESTVTHTGRG